MFISLASIVAWIATYGYVVMLPIAIVEGPIVTIIGAFLAAHGLLNVYIVYLISILGDIFGDLLYYAIGRWGRDSIIVKWGHYVGISESRIEKLEKHFKNHSGKTLVIAKITHGIGSVVLTAAGAAKMPIPEFIWYNLISSLPKSLLFVLIGYFFGAAYERISKYIDYTALVMFIVAAVLVVIYFLIVKIVRKRNKE